jgi:serine/threonine-protein kinase
MSGKYRLVRFLGEGGMGTVWLAHNEALGSAVALKVLRDDVDVPDQDARFEREARAAAFIEHPAIVRVLDFGRAENNRPFIVMQYLEGESLLALLQRLGPLPPAEAVRLLLPIVDALSHAHEKGVVHRDLKPGNIFLCDDGSAKVLDFGMSKLTTAESLTQAGYTLGTPEYMAPEQCIGGNVEPRTDIYALGVLIYEALMGELPITAANRRDLLDLHQRQVPLSMRKRRPDLDVPEALDDIVMRCLKKRVQDRPKSAAELVALLESIPRQGLALAYPASVSRKPPPLGPPSAATGDATTLSAVEPSQATAIGGTRSQ